MTATRVFLVLFSLFLHALSISGQLCLTETAGASGVLGNAAGVFTAAGTLTGVQGVYIEKLTTSAGYGHLFVVATGLHAVFRYSSAAAFTNNQAVTATYGTSGTSGVTGTNFLSPTYITSDANGVCYLSDTGNKRLVMFATCYTSTTGTGAVGDTVTSITTAGAGTATNGITNPTGISTDSTVAGGLTTANPLFVAMAGTSTTSNVITKFTNAVITGASAFINTAATAGTNVFGTASTTCSTTLLCSPAGIRFYSALNSLFIANSGVISAASTNAVIRLNTASGTPTTVLYGGGSACSSSDINAAKGVAYDTASNVLYVADSGNNRVLFFTGTASSVATGTFFPNSATFTACPASTVSQNNANPSDVDVVTAAQNPSGVASVVISDLTNLRVLRLCSTSTSVSITLTNSVGASLSNSLGAAGLSPSITTTLGAASAISSSISVSSGSGISLSNSLAAATVAISTSPTNSITVSLTASYSLSLTVSITTSLTTSITTSITTSFTNTNSYSPSITTSVTNSYSTSTSTSNTGSYSNTVSNSYSITVSRSVRLCGNGKIDGLEKCDAGYGVNGKHSSCCSRRCKPKDGGKICKDKSVQCLGHGRCTENGLCRGGKILVNKRCSTSGSGTKNGRCDISANCVATSA